MYLCKSVYFYQLSQKKVVCLLHSKRDGLRKPQYILSFCDRQNTDGRAGRQFTIKKKTVSDWDLNIHTHLSFHYVQVYVCV